MSAGDVRFERRAFAGLTGWAEDGHLPAFEAFAVSGQRLLDRSLTSGEPRTPEPLLATIRAALTARCTIRTDADARAFFETFFVPHRVCHAEPAGMVTGYYEPVVAGSRSPSSRFYVPILRRPPDLVNLVPESERGAKADALTHAHQTPTGLVPYATRAEIENGALAGQGLELVWLEDAVDAFFLHV